jgi:uncharacterized protein (DUF58 family)
MTPFALVMLKLSVLALPLGALAWALRVYPRERLVYAAIVPALATGAILAAPRAVWAVVGLDAVLAVLAAGDLLTLPRRRAIFAERHAGRIASLRKSHPVSLVVSNRGAQAATLRVRDGMPHELNPQPAEFLLHIAPRSRSTLSYVLRPRRRGAFAIDCVHLQARSRLGFWQRLMDYPLTTAVNVYPDMRQLSQYALLARTDRLSLLGVRHTRRIGHDHDFERLRDYEIDDNYKHIDWRATARRRKLTVKDFQTSQSQRILFLVDCGRMMTNEAAGLSLLDHALNAVLMLSYVALRQRDSVGMITFSDEIHGFVPPASGMNHMNRLLHASFDRFPRLVESRYDLAFRYLASHCRRRSLVVLVTNLIDEVNSNQIERYLANLAGRHLPMAVLLRDHHLFDAVDKDGAGGERVPADEALWRAAAAADILTWRHQSLSDLQQKGVLALDVFPEQMTAPLINRYLEIKARHLL